DRMRDFHVTVVQTCALPIWLVPERMDGTHGVYLRFPREDLMRLIALESHRYKAIVIGEDLGTVPAGFSESLAAAGLMGIRVLWLARKSAEQGISGEPRDDAR